MPPPGYEPFLKMICANPADDAPRLVYADWLDENDAADRAEFIRVQIELNRIRRPALEPPALLERERVLRRMAEVHWRHELPAWLGVDWGKYWRGFIHGIRFHSLAAFRAHAVEAFAQTPVNQLTLRAVWAREVSMFVREPLLQRLSILHLRGPLEAWTPRSWQQLANSPNLGNLEWLILTRERFSLRSTLDATAAQHLANGSALGKVKRIAINGIADPSAEAVLRERFGTRLTLL
jgi:uncharacterized protein (TIGR02996 family)